MKIDKPFYSVDRDALPWYLTATVGIEFGPTGCTVNDEQFMRRMSGKDIAEKALTANAEYLILFCKDCEYSYYHSKLRPSPPSLEGRDLLKEVCDAAKGKDVKVLAYAVVQYDSYIIRNNPSWEMIDEDGQKTGRVCLRQPGYIEYMKQVLDELAAYDIVGIHVDMMDLGFGKPYGCWCEHCKAEFRKSFGKEMPPKIDFDNPEWKDGMEFRYSNSKDMSELLAAHIRENHPKLSIDFNYHGAPPFSFEVGERPVQHSKYGDFVTGEALPWIFGYNNVSMMSHFLRAVNPENPFQVVGSRSMYNYHEYSLRPTEDLRFEVMNILSNGGTFTLVDKAGYDGWFDPVVYQRMSGVFKEAREKAKYTRGYEHQPLCALYYSHKTRDYKYRESSVEYLNTFAGLTRMLVQAHIDYTFVFDENVTLEELKKHRLIILPSAAVLSEAEAEMIRLYVMDGGNILATGPVGLCDAQGKITGECVLEDVLGAKFVRAIENSNDTYIVFPDGTPEEYKYVTNGFEDGYQLYAQGHMYEFSPVSAKTFGDLYIGFRPNTDYDPDNINADIWLQLMSAGIKVCPAVFLNDYGKGKAVTVPCMTESAYMGSHRSPEQRMLICNLVESMCKVPRVKADLPLNTEMVVTEDTINGDLLVHLVTYNPTLPALDAWFFNDRRFYAPVMEEPMLYKGKLVLSQPYKKAVSVDGTPLEFDGRTVSFTTDKVYEIIILKKE